MKSGNQCGGARKDQFLILALATGSILISLATATIACQTNLVSALIGEWDTRDQLDDVIPYVWGGLTIFMQIIFTLILCIYTKRRAKVRSVVEK
jgi:hypothetical protein